MDNFYFNPFTHEYFLNGRRIPGVTEVLPKQNFFVAPWILEGYRREGIANHKKIKDYLDTGDDHGDQYVKTFQRCLDEHSEWGKLLRYETPMYYDGQFSFAGTPDFIFEHAIIDLKRSYGKKKFHALQLAGYDILNYNVPNPLRIILVINGNEYKLHNVYIEEAEDVFLLLVRQWWDKKIVEEYFKSDKEKSNGKN
jgi:hypothetical protein